MIAAYNGVGLSFARTFHDQKKASRAVAVFNAVYAGVRRMSERDTVTILANCISYRLYNKWLCEVILKSQKTCVFLFFLKCDLNKTPIIGLEN